MNKRIKGILFWGGGLVIVFVFCRNKHTWICIIWIFVWAVFLGLVDFLVRGRKGRKNKARKPVGPPDPRIDTSRKALFATLNYFASNFLFLLNPFILAQSFL